MCKDEGFQCKCSEKKRTNDKQGYLRVAIERRLRLPNDYLGHTITPAVSPYLLTTSHQAPCSFPSSSFSIASTTKAPPSKIAGSSIR